MRSSPRPGVFSVLRPARAAPRPPWPCHCRSFAVPSSARLGIQPVPAADALDLTLEAFRERAFVPQKPLFIKAGPGGRHGPRRTLPATSRWFQGQPGPSMRLAASLERFAAVPLPYELMCPPQPGRGEPLVVFVQWLAASTPTPTPRPAGAVPAAAALRPALAQLLSHSLSARTATDAGEEPRLVRLEAPLALFLAAAEYNAHRHASPEALTQLYIAQAPLSALPRDLQQDVPAPDLVQHAGRGDVYDSSVWLGLEPTNTPWHRDPNPNLFCQLCSSKTVRLMAPAAGERIFRRAQEELLARRQGGGSSPRIRGEEMMQGPERELLNRAIWGGGDENRHAMHEASLGAGDMLFIPKGWWHSVRSGHADGRLNGSVNWWFR